VCQYRYTGFAVLFSRYSLYTVFRHNFGGGMATFAERLKQVRQAAGLSQSELATKASVPLGTLREYEQGRRADPGFHAMMRLAKALGVDCTAFADCVQEETTPAEELKPAKGRKKGPRS
jgi:transcriptional regulator with XRE-family HTH domain